MKAQVVRRNVRVQIEMSGEEADALHQVSGAMTTQDWKDILVNKRQVPSNEADKLARLISPINTESGLYGALDDAMRSAGLDSFTPPPTSFGTTTGRTPS